MMDSGYNPDLDSIDATEFMDSLLDDPEVLRIYNERYADSDPQTIVKKDPKYGPKKLRKIEPQQ